MIIGLQGLLYRLPPLQEGENERGGQGEENKGSDTGPSSLAPTFVGNRALNIGCDIVDRDIAGMVQEMATLFDLAASGQQPVVGLFVFLPDFHPGADPLPGAEDIPVRLNPLAQLIPSLDQRLVAHFDDALTKSLVLAGNQESGLPVCEAPDDRLQVGIVR